MKGKLLGRISNSPKYLILREIKRSQGLSVAELCKRVGLSYMGVKQHCVSMEKEGYLDTWRRPKGMGRPEKAYRLTQHAQDFFPTEYSNFTCDILESVQQIYGLNASEKILYNIYKNQIGRVAKQVKGDTLEERARQLTALRDEQGFMSEYVYDPASRQHQIIDYNNPVIICMDRFPIMREIERQMLEKILMVTMTREEKRVSGLYKCIFRFSENKAA
ncbi:MAG: helix-turn-helix transcriptional regulator [Verrucomicrobiota bacterium]